MAVLQGQVLLLSRFLMVMGTTLLPPCSTEVTFIVVAIICLADAASMILAGTLDHDKVLRRSSCCNIAGPRTLSHLSSGSDYTSMSRHVHRHRCHRCAVARHVMGCVARCFSARMIATGLRRLFGVPKHGGVKRSGASSHSFRRAGFEGRRPDMHNKGCNQAYYHTTLLQPLYSSS